MLFRSSAALGVLDSGEPNATPLVVERVAEQQTRCFTRMFHGYAPLEANGAQFRYDHLYNVRPDIADYLTAHRTDDACAGSRNAAQAVAGDAVRNSTITVPVLVLAGADDRLFPNPGLQALTYRASPSVSVRVVPETGHAVAFGREHTQFNDDMDHWLGDNDL